VRISSGIKDKRAVQQPPPTALKEDLMSLAPHRIIPNDPNLLPAVRDLLSRHPAYQEHGACEIRQGLFWLRYMNYRPHESAVEAAPEALTVEGEVLP
jgi:hypothetical protein